MTTKLNYKTLLTSVLTLMLGTLAAPSWAITVQEVADMGSAGVSDDVIISMIAQSDSSPKLAPNDVINLKQSGVGDAVLRYLLDVRDERREEYQYDQAVRRQMLMNFQFPPGYFDTTYSARSTGFGGSLAPSQNYYRGTIGGTGYGPGAMTSGGGGGGYGPGGGSPYGPYGAYPYVPDHISGGPNGVSEYWYNYGNNPGVLYDNLGGDDIWSWNMALYGVPPANNLYFRN